MGESHPADPLVAIRKSLGEFINESYGLKHFLNLTAKLDKANEGPPPIRGNFVPPEGMWLQIARWWKRYLDRLRGFDAVADLLNSRWGNSRLWIDEAKGSIYHLVVYLQPGSFLSPAEIHILETAFGEMNEADARITAQNERWAKEHRDAIERQNVNGVRTGIVNDPKWRQIEEEMEASREEISE
jgi:hypothetical protein